MSVCINTSSAEYQTLLKLSGLPDFYLQAMCGDFLEKHDRFPHLDEILGADSSKYLSQLLNLKHGGTKISSILELTGKDTIEEALIYLNNTFHDLEITIVPLSNEALVRINKRPISKPLNSNYIEHSEYANSGLMFESIINKLRNLYGILLNAIDSSELSEMELANIPGTANAKAFIYDGQIYINTDFADKNAPIHEMMHILMGSLRNSDPKLYFQIANWISTTEVFSKYLELYPNRTMSDVAEEAFVGEFSKLATANKSALQNFPNKVKYELFYHAKRVLDSALMGELSTKDYDNETLFNSSLIELCDMVNSTLDVNKFPATISLENGEAHRLLANKKQELMENNELEEYCNA